MSVPVSGGQLVGLSGLGTPRGLTVECNSVHFSRHAIERMFQRSIPPDGIFECIRSGEVIANYPDDSPYPSALLLISRSGPRFMCSLPDIAKRETVMW
jgi:hypothetical protein